MGYEVVQGIDLNLKKRVLEELVRLKEDIDKEAMCTVEFYEIKNMTEVAILILTESLSMNAEVPETATETLAVN